MIGLYRFCHYCFWSIQAKGVVCQSLSKTGFLCGIEYALARKDLLLMKFVTANPFAAFFGFDKKMVVVNAAFLVKVILPSATIVPAAFFEGLAIELG